MFIIEETDIFKNWLLSISDKRALKIIAARLNRLTHGHFGDVKPVKPANKGISELRFDYGSGYRIYYTKRGREIILLLCGGDKSSQERDIKKAIEIAEQWSERNG